MNQNPPTEAEVVGAFPEVSELAFVSEGGFKFVYRASIGGRREIFKLVRLPASGNSDDERAYREECQARIQREVALLGKLKQPEIVKLGALAPRVATVGGLDCVGYSEELLDGPNLWEVIQAKGPKPTEAESMRLLLSLLLAIRELWGHEVIHRDIKPQNVIRLGAPERPFVLLDLGIAYVHGETGLTNDAARVMATGRYFAPEMAKAGFRQNLDFRTDLYTAGLTVFEYSAQFHPLARTGDDPIRTISRAIHQAPASLRSKRPDFSEVFCRQIDQMLKKKPALRPANLGQMIATLEREL